MPCLVWRPSSHCKDANKLSLRWYYAACIPSRRIMVVTTCQLVLIDGQMVKVILGSSCKAWRTANSGSTIMAMYIGYGRGHLQKCECISTQKVPVGSVTAMVSQTDNSPFLGSWHVQKISDLCSKIRIPIAKQQTITPDGWWVRY